MHITALSQTIKDHERVNVFIDGEFAMAVDKNTVVDDKLFIGKEIDQTYLEHLKDSDTYNYVLRRILNWLGNRPHSAREIKDKVIEVIAKRRSASINKQIDVAALTEYITIKLNSMGFNDRSFATWWIESRLGQAKYGKRKVYSELLSKGVDREIATELIQAYFPDDKQIAQNLLQAKFNVSSLSEIKDIKERARAYRFLSSRGF